MKERKHRFVVGHHGDKQCVYGKNVKGQFRWVDPLTEFQARRMLRNLSPADDATIYELVPYKKQTL